MRKEFMMLGAAAGWWAIKQRSPDLKRFYADRGCVVTGAGSGFGLAMVRRLAELEARIVAVDVNQERLTALQAELPHVHTLTIDITAEDAPERIDTFARQHVQRIDLLHNNAGIAISGPFIANNAEHIRAMVMVNLLAHIQLTRQVIPAMVEHGGGDIVFTASLSSWVAAPSLAVYSGTKAGIKQFAHALRRELWGTGVRISCLAPNIVRTQLMPSEVFDQVRIKYGIDETVAALLSGVARGQRDVFINGEDRLLQRLEQLAPDLLDWLFQQHPDVKKMLARGATDGRMQ